MPLPVIPGVLRGTVGGVVTGGGRWANTWHFQRVDLGPADLVLVTEIHAILMALYSTTILGFCPSTTTLELAGYTPLDGSSGAFSLPGGITGSGAGGSVSPPEVAEVLTIRTALRGRQNRGRVFLPAFSGTYFPGGRLDPSTVSAIVTAAVVAQAAALVAGWTFGVASYGVSKRYDRTVKPPRVVETHWDPHFTPVTSFSMDGLADVVRGRKT